MNNTTNRRNASQDVNRQAEKQAIFATPLGAVPDWVTTTPEEPVQYMLGMINWDAGEAAQELVINRKEYIELKRHLAVMRAVIQ